MRIYHGLQVKINVNTQQGKWKILSLKFAIYILDIFRLLVVLGKYPLFIFYEIQWGQIEYKSDKWVIKTFYLLSR